MVNGQKVDYHDLCLASSDEKDAMLAEAYGITGAELETVRYGITRYERLAAAAKLLRSKTADGKQFTSHNLAAISSPAEEWNGREMISRYGVAMARALRADTARIEGESGMKVPAIHVLRKIAGVYDGNLEEASAVWGKKIRASTYDWQRSVTIPQEIDRPVSQLLGMIWGDGGCHHDNDRTHSVGMAGRRADRELYEGVIPEAVKMIFNIDASVRTVSGRRTTGGAEFDYEIIKVGVNSSAVYTWLTDALGFPKAGEPYGLPAARVDRQGFFEGLFATAGSVHTHKDKRCAPEQMHYEIASMDRDFVGAIKGLTDGLGYSASVYDREEGRTADLVIRKKSEIGRIGLINPRHRRIAGRVRQSPLP